LLAFSLLNMAMAVVFIQLIASELVGALSAFGTLTGCPEALLGVVVSFGNSMGDLATNLGVAKATFVRNGERMTGERIAVSACMNGQVFNLLLAPAIGLLWRLHAVGGGAVALDLSWPVWLMADVLASYVAAMIAVSFLFGHTLPRRFAFAAFAVFGAMTALLAVGFIPVWIAASG